MSKEVNEIELTEVELLKVENIQLKLSAVKAKGAALMAEAERLNGEIEERLGIDDINQFRVDFKTRKGVKIAQVKGGKDGKEKSA